MGSDSTPTRWREDFPVNWEDDHSVTRRQFTAFLSLVSSALFLATGFVGVREWWRRRLATEPLPVRIATVGEVPVGGVKVFHYPTPHDPCLLLRLSADRFVAYSQKCPHLSCPVVYRGIDQGLYCPCHAGRFAAEDGRVLAGPPRRRLPRVVLARRGDELWATGTSG